MLLGSPLIGKGQRLSQQSPFTWLHLEGLQWVFCLSSVHGLLVDAEWWTERKGDDVGSNTKTWYLTAPHALCMSVNFHWTVPPHNYRGYYSKCFLFSLLPSCQKAQTLCRYIAPGSWRQPGWQYRKPGRWQQRRPRPGPWSYWSFLSGFQWGPSC